MTLYDIYIHIYIWRIYSNFWNILTPYFFDTIVKAMEPTFIFVENVKGGEPRFCAIDTWSWGHKNIIFTWWYLCQNVRCHFVALIETERFHIVTHCQAASFSRKLVLCQTNNIFYSQEYHVWHKDDNRFWKVIGNEGEATLDSFRNLPMSAVIRIWQIWHENESTQYLKNYKCHKLDEDDFGKLI